MCLLPPVSQTPISFSRDAVSTESRLRNRLPTQHSALCRKTFNSLQSGSASQTRDSPLFVDQGTMLRRARSLLPPQFSLHFKAGPDSQVGDPAACSAPAGQATDRGRHCAGRTALSTYSPSPFTAASSTRQPCLARPESMLSIDGVHFKVIKPLLTCTKQALTSTLCRRS